MRRPLLYDAVGAGMAAYARVVHRAVAIGASRLRLVPGAVFVSAHLSDADVPVIAGTLFAHSGMWRRPDAVRPAFAVRNDLLEPGFLAGYPPRLPLALRRLAFGVDVGPILRDRLRCLPLRFADRLRLVEALRARPDADLAAALPAALTGQLAARARAAGRPVPRTARDALDGVYADLLWQVVGEDALAGPAWASMWAQRLSQAGVELGAILRHVRAGGALVLFPHGFPSADGGIDPLDPRAGRLLSHLRASVVQPLGIAYDPLVAGRPRAFVAVGTPIGRVPRRGGHEVLLGALRATTPVTAGLVVAHELAGTGRAPSPRRAAALVDAAVARARREGRPVDPALLEIAPRHRRVGEALDAARRLGVGHPAVARAARTASAALAEAA